ncbi:hypothetical protein [Kitasatospora sp. NPDC004272]
MADPVVVRAEVGGGPVAFGLAVMRTGRDALESTPAGASGVAVGSEPLRDPTAPLRTPDELRARLRRPHRRGGARPPHHHDGRRKTADD